MKPESPETADLLNRVRQQLILAQVRIMELEDERDSSVTQLANSTKLLQSAQTLADQKVDEAAHVATIHAELQAQLEHLRHVQHVTNEALNATRKQQASAEKNTEALQRKIISLVDQSSQLNATLETVRGELAESTATANSHLFQLTQIEAELTALKASRSWRWTAPFRRLVAGKAE